MSFCGIWSQMSTKALASSYRLWSCGRLCLNHLPSRSQICSMRFRYRLSGGWFKRVISFFFKKCWQILVTCGRALSCMKNVLPSLYLNGSTESCNTSSIYRRAVKCTSGNADADGNHFLCVDFRIARLQFFNQKYIWKSFIFWFFV